MSLDVYLFSESEIRITERIFIRENGANVEVSRAEWNLRFPDREPVYISERRSPEIYSRNITHNLAKMANAAGIYDALWRPDEHGLTKAEHLIQPLREGLTRLQQEPERFKAFNPANGWGNYEGLVDFVADYLKACELNPSAKVEVSR